MGPEHPTLSPREQFALAQKLQQWGVTASDIEFYAVRTRLEELSPFAKPELIDAIVAMVKTGGVRRLLDLEDGRPFEGVATEIVAETEQRLQRQHIVMEPGLIAQAMSVWAMAVRQHIRGVLAAILSENPRLAQDASACREALVEYQTVHLDDGTEIILQQALIDLLIRAIRAGVTTDLRKLPRDVSHQWIAPQLIKRMQNDGLELWQVNWAIESWAFALGRPPGDVGMPEPQRPRSILRRVFDTAFGAIALGILAMLIAASLWRHDDMAGRPEITGYSDSLKCILWGLGIGALAGLGMGRLGAETVRTGFERTAICAGILVGAVTGALLGWFIVVVNMSFPWQDALWSAFLGAAVLGAINGFRGRQPAGRTGCLGAIGYLLLCIAIVVFTDEDVGSFYPSDAAGGMEVFLLVVLATTCIPGWWVGKWTNQWLGRRTGHRHHRGHRGDVSDVAIQPGSGHDSSRLVVVSCSRDDPIIRIWNSDSGAAWQLSGHSLGVHTLAFSPDGSLLFSAGKDLQGCLWSTTDWQPLHHLEGHSKTVNTAAFSNDGLQVATGSDDGTLLTWNAATGESLDRWQHDGPVVSVAACPLQPGRWIAACEDHSVQSWITRHAEPELVSHCDFDITCLAIAQTEAEASEENEMRVAFAGGNQVTVVAMAGGGHHESTFALEKGETVHDIVFSPDTRRVYVAVDTSLRSLDLSTRSWQTLLEPSQKITALNLTSDESTLATGGAHGMVWLRPTLGKAAAVETENAITSTPARSPLPVRCLNGFTLWYALALGAGAAGSCLGLLAGIFAGPFLVPSFSDRLTDEAGWVPVVQRAISAGVDWTGWIAVAITVVPAASIAHAWMKEDWTRSLIRVWGARTIRRSVRSISTATGIIVSGVAIVQWQREVPLLDIGFNIVFLVFGIGMPLIYLSWIAGQCLGLRRRFPKRHSSDRVLRFHSLLDEDTQRERRQLDRSIAFSYGLMIPGLSGIMLMLYLLFAFVPTDGTASGRGCRTTDFNHPQYVPVEDIMRDSASDPFVASREYVSHSFQIRGIVQNWETDTLRLCTSSGETAAICLLDDETTNDLRTNQFKVDGWERVQLQPGQPAILFGECLGPNSLGVTQFRNCSFHYSTFYPDIQARLDSGTIPITVETDDENALTGPMALTAYSVALVSGVVFLLWVRVPSSRTQFSEG